MPEVYLITLLLFLFSNNIIDIYLGNAPKLKSVAVNIFRLFLITLPLTSVISIISAYLQSEFEFKAPVISQLWLNISIILLVIFFTKELNIYAIPAGYILGTIIQLIYLSVKLKGRIQVNFKSLNKSWLVNFSFNAILLTVAIEVVGQLYVVVDRFFYNRVDTGGIAALNSANNIFVLPIAIISMAFSTALFPKFSQEFFSENKESLIKSFNNSLIINSFIFIPISLILIFYGDIITKIFYQRGEFKVNDTIVTFNILRIYALCLIFYSSYAVVNKLLYGMNAIKFLTFVSIMGLAIKITFSYILVDEYKQNGLAVSSAMAYTFIFLMGFIGSLKMIKMQNKILIFNESFMLLVNGLLSFLIVKILFELIHIQDGFIQIIKIILFVSLYIYNLDLLKHKSLIIIKDNFNSWKSSLVVKSNI